MCGARVSRLDVSVGAERQCSSGSAPPPSFASVVALLLRHCDAVTFRAHVPWPQICSTSPLQV